MRSVESGRRTSKVEATNISRHGFWLLIRDRELFVPFAEYPWFKDASIGALLTVELLHAGHLYWPDLDVDLSVESIEYPERFPLVSKVLSNPVPYRTRRSQCT